MKTLIFDGLFLNNDLPCIFDGKTSMQILFEKASKDNYDRYILIQNGKITKIPDGIKNVILNNFSAHNILNTASNESKNSDDIFIINAGSPFYDADFIKKMHEHHGKYFADYTYCMGYAEGLTPSIVKKNIIKELIELVKEDKTISKDYMFYSISKDINAFDIETLLSDFDLRIYRISLGCRDKGEEIQSKRLFDMSGTDLGYDQINEYLKSNISEISTIPYLATIELTDYSQTSSIYYPESGQINKYLNAEKIKNIFDDLLKLNGKINIILGGIGDPLFHPDFFDILKYLSGFENQIIIETFGQNITDEMIKKLNTLNKDNIVFVFKIDAYEEKTYKIIHNGGDFNKALNALKTLNASGFKTYKQIVRMTENEIEIENFIKNKETDNLIIRKFSTYCGMLADKKTVDLSPIERIPCFHLRRQIYIKSDGTVPACAYAAFKDIIGDTDKENISIITDKLHKLYQKNAKNDYPDFCINCNDYYLFNF